jgi:Tfp pilus assembly protein PilP
VAGAGSGKQLQPQLTIEDRVICRVESNPKKRCDPKTPKCDKASDHCITNSEGSFCGPCKERDTIRRTFRPRDFVATVDTRDPFQSFIVSQPGLGSGSDDKVLDPAKNCTREDQIVAQNYSYQDLKLVGIVTQGTQRKVLMLDSANLGHIIKRGDCVGKEKAVVREIGKAFVTFEVHPDAGSSGTKRDPERREVQLYPKQVPVSALPSEQPPRGAPITPVIAPPPAPPAPGAGSAAPARPGTRIQVVPPQPGAPVVPPPAPTTLRP